MLPAYNAGLAGLFWRIDDPWVVVFDLPYCYDIYQINELFHE
jgi:hypothetical protein